MAGQWGAVARISRYGHSEFALPSNSSYSGSIVRRAQTSVREKWLETCTGSAGVGRRNGKRRKRSDKQRSESGKTRKNQEVGLDVAFRGGSDEFGRGRSFRSARLLASKDELAGASPRIFLPGLPQLWR